MRKMIQTNPGTDFVERSLRTTGIVLLVQLPFTMFYLGVWQGLALLFGGVWGIINLLFIAHLVRSAIRPEGPDKVKTAILLLVKFPLLYMAGYFLLTINQLQPVYLAAGFSLLLIIVVLKVLGRMMLKLDEKSENNTTTALGAAL